MKNICYLSVALAACYTAVIATPSTTFWTPCTPDMQSPQAIHLTYDCYDRFGSPSKDLVPSFPKTIGLTGGSMIKGKLSLEYGIDYLFPADNPFYFNVRLGYLEGVVSPSAPALQIGVFNIGVKKGVTDQNIAYLVVGKTLSHNRGRLSAAYYVGNANTLRNSDGKKENAGFMIAYDRPIKPDKLVFAADYASGRNAIGGGGFGINYLFAKNASLLVGPVWFNDKGLNGKMKWTIQLDLNL